eukprot:8198-Heterococcus_DN1.PRE.8
MKDSVSGSEIASSHHFEYVALRIMDLEVAQDRASVTAIAATAVPLLVRLPRGQRCATEDSRQAVVAAAQQAQHYCMQRRAKRTSTNVYCNALRAHEAS